MYVKPREESIEDLSAKLSDFNLKRAITQGYSDICLSVISQFKREYAAEFFYSQFSVSTINKLTEAYAKEKIDHDDLFQAIKYSYCNAKNESYVDEFLKSIDDKVLGHTTATKTFSACLFEDCSYKEAMDYVKSGAFRPTKYASLSVTNEVAEQLDRMGASLRACEGFNYCYDVDDLKEALDRGAAIFVEDKDVALKVCEYMKLPDWSSFRSKVEYEMGRDIANLTGNKLDELYIKHTIDKRSVALHDKVRSEYDSFIEDMKKKPVETVIESAYEIVSKENIVMYCDEYVPELSEKQFEALMSSRNMLDEVYKQWRDNGDLEDFRDIGISIVEAADRIQVSLDREKQEKIAAEKNDIVPEQKQAVKPKNKSR